MTEKTNILELMHGIGKSAKEAARQLTMAPTESKNAALLGTAEALRRNQNRIMSENAKDIALGAEKELTKAMLDRLRLDEGRIEATSINAAPFGVGFTPDLSRLIPASGWKAPISP
mgnify:CR=1 FL=1